jgi:pimeloyl-ACP methyl ester carboxylesterase
MNQPASTNGDRPQVVYLPGLDGTGRLLHRQSALHALYRVNCVSYPQDRFTTYEELADLGAERIRAGGRPAVVLAESFGGAVALTLALRHPELVERLVLVNTFAWFPSRLFILLGATFGPYLPARPSPPRSRGLRGWFFFAPEIPAAERDEWWNRTSDVPMRGFGYRMRLIHGLDLRPRLGEVRQPALVLAAPNDRVVPCRAGRDLARRLPAARLLEPRVGHAALIHPSIDVARLLAEATHWPARSTADTSATRPAGRSG